MRKVGRFFADLYFLMKPYFVSREWKIAWTLLIVILTLNLGQVGLGLVLSFSRNIFYTALQQKDAASFFRGLFWFTPRPRGWPVPGFVPMAIVLIGSGVLATYVQSWLQIRWQRWMTDRFVNQWLEGHAHFRLMLTNSMQGLGADNPDQRIQEDIEDVTSNSLSFTVGVVSNIATVISYGGLIWALSGPLVLFGFHVHGWLFWAAVIWSLLVTWLTHLLGRPLASLTFQQQRLRGNFRFSLVKVRENTEAIALSGGEREERRGLGQRFNDYYANFFRIMNRTAWVTLLTGSVSDTSDYFPLIINAPRFFAGKITFGALMQITQLFQDLQGAFLWFMSQYPTFAAYAAQIERLATFQRALDGARARQSDLRIMPPKNPGIVARDLTLSLPDGRPLLASSDLQIRPGESTAIVGPSGTGKSTLFRALAGIWPFGSGEIAGPPAGSLFLPQKPYLPEGTLRRALCYPKNPNEIAETELRHSLDLTGLSRLTSLLDEEAAWSQRLSPGEQQRVAIARALLIRPTWLFLDEATASLDAAAEAELFAALRHELPETTLVSITHREALARLHDRLLRLAPEGIAEAVAA